MPIWEVIAKLENIEALLLSPDWAQQTLPYTRSLLEESRAQFQKMEDAFAASQGQEFAEDMPF